MNISTMNSIQHAGYLHQLKLEAAHQSAIRPAPSKRIAFMLAGIITVSPVASAALPPDLEVFNGMQEVSDNDLGHMRGKFASNNQVLYFGVEMISQWETSTGSVITAGANLNIDFRSNTPSVHYAPTVSIEQSQNTITTQQTDGSNNVSGGAGLANISGVSQTIQVAGASNSIHNGIDMQVELTSSNQGGSVANAVSGQAGLVSATASDGTVATVTLSHNSVGVNVMVPGQGQILQEIRNQGMFQAARIGGDLNQIHNAITMHIGLNTATGIDSTSAFAAIQSLKSLPRNSF